jgi:hypothetical protein
MNKNDKVQFEREIVRVATELEASKGNKSEPKKQEELNNLMRHINV